MSSNIVIEKNMSRYDLIIGEYTHHYNEQTMCFFTWLLNGNTGPTVTWQKGSRLDLGYLSSKTSDINKADMVGIMSEIRKQHPEWINGMFVPEGYESYE
jgi:hypothetical protein